MFDFVHLKGFSQPWPDGTCGWSIFPWILQMGVGSIPSQGGHIGCGFGHSWGTHRRQLINVSVYHSLSLSLPLPLSLRSINISSGEGKNRSEVFHMQENLFMCVTKLKKTNPLCKIKVAIGFRNEKSVRESLLYLSV